MKCMFESLESRTFFTVTGASIVAAQAAIQTAVTACESDLTTMESVLSTDDSSIYAAATGITAAKSLTLLSEVHTNTSEGRALFDSELTTLTSGVLAATATTGTDAGQLISAFSKALEKSLIADEKALTVSVGTPFSKFKTTVDSNLVDNELKSISSQNGQNAALRSAITLRIADSKSLRTTLIAAGAELKTQALDLVKLAKKA